MQDFQTPIAEHHLLDRLTASLIEIAEDPVPDIVAVLYACANLSIALDFQSSEIALLREELTDTWPDMPRAEATKSHADVTALASTWRRHLTIWRPSTISANWTQFCAETTHMMGWLRQHIADEDVPLYLLAPPTGQPGLREAA
jgi:hypothetical protein